jgi:transcriptional regulator with XRE-family HTH domain
MEEAARRKELGDFLRKSRERRTPAEAGLPAGSRRKTPGLRRQEVADLAGVGPTWYTWLEQGRQINPSPRTLGAIAEALGLSRPERDHLFRLANGLPGRDSGESGDRESPDVPDAVRAVMSKVDPFPSCVYTLSYDLLLCNDAYAACFPDLAATSGEERNILRYFSRLSSTDLAAHEDLVRAMVHRFRSNYSAHLESPRWRALVEDVILRNALMKEYWEKHVVLEASDHSLDTVSTTVGEIAFTPASFTVGVSPVLNVLVGVPRSERDHQLLTELLAAHAWARDGR